MWFKNYYLRAQINNNRKTTRSKVHRINSNQITIKVQISVHRKTTSFKQKMMICMLNLVKTLILQNPNSKIYRFTAQQALTKTSKMTKLSFHVNPLVKLLLKNVVILWWAELNGLNWPKTNSMAKGQPLKSETWLSNSKNLLGKQVGGVRLKMWRF